MSTSAIERLNAALSDRYRIERELGEGGMATVYVADDLKHERKVALKLLKPELAAVVGAERFLAEIKTTANLQHPHILPLFDSGEADSFVFYVMPLVQGESLRERLDKNPQLPVDEAVRIATDVAEALDYAHRNGVIHRDIKPANILLHDGQPVVSDFGIALAVTAGGGSRLTETGLSLGTPHYMSPEQATGSQHIGPATDIYALGCVLYEMLVGEPPFTGSTPQAILGKIVVGQLTPVVEQRGAVPSNVGAAAAKALEKVPADRFRTAGGIASALGDASFRWPPKPVTAGERTWRRAFVATSVVAMVTTLLWIGGIWRGPPPSGTGQTIELSFNLPEGQLLDLVSDPTLALSPDGTRLVYAAAVGADRRLYLRDMASSEVTPIDGTEGGSGPFFSPSGEHFGFFTSDALFTVSLEGGIPVRIAEVPGQPEGASWGDDGFIAFARDSSVWRVPETGGPLEEIPLVFDSIDLGDGGDVGLPTVRNSARWLTALPGGAGALVVVSYSPRTIGAVDFATGRFRPLIVGDRPSVIGTGDLVLLSGDDGATVSVVPFDLRRLAVIGAPRPLVDDLLKPAGSRNRFAVSKSGVLAWLPGGFERSVVLVDRNGRPQQLDLATRGYRFPRVSPDGRHIAITVSPAQELWIIDPQRPNAEPFVTGAYDLAASWSPDGTRIALSRQGVGIVSVPWPAGGEPSLVAVGGGPIDWLSNDRILARTDVSAWDLDVIDVTSGTATTWLASSATTGWPRTSPDGNWVAYASDATGALEVYVRPSTGGPATSVSAGGGGTEPRWSGDATEIFYRNGNTIMAVNVRTTPDFEVTGAPVPLLSGSYDFSNDNNWDVMQDGRFVMIESGPNLGREVRFRLNWLGN